jgi:hypothetical protein
MVQGKSITAKLSAGIYFHLRPGISGLPRTTDISVGSRQVSNGPNAGIPTFIPLLPPDAAVPTAAPLNSVKSPT